jgi:hypothetical protein
VFALILLKIFSIDWLELPKKVWQRMAWREGANTELTGRFAAVRGRPAHRDYQCSTPSPEEWRLIEWPADEPEPTNCVLSTLPATISRERWWTLQNCVDGSSGTPSISGWNSQGGRPPNRGNFR